MKNKKSVMMFSQTVEQDYDNSSNISVKIDTLKVSNKSNKTNSIETIVIGSQNKTTVVTKNGAPVFDSAGEEVTLHVIDGKFYTDEDKEVDTGIIFIPKTLEDGKNIKAYISKNGSVQILSDLQGEISF